jgi:hypothetical protein
MMNIAMQYFMLHRNINSAIEPHNLMSVPQEPPMSKKTKSPVELASDFVADSLDTAKAAFSTETDVAKEGFEALNQSAKLYQARFADLTAKSVDIAETNTKAFFSFWRDVSAVKSADALFALQQDYVKAQSEAAMKHFQDINTVTVALVREASAPMQAGLNKAFAGLNAKAA